jgi:hypothetical protein
MTDELAPSVSDQLSDLKATITDGLKTATSTIGEAVETGKKPGNALNLLSKMTRDAPLGMLLAAFLVGRALARRSDDTRRIDAEVRPSKGRDRVLYE